MFGLFKKKGLRKHRHWDYLKRKYKNCKTLDDVIKRSCQINRQGKT
jgi:hypothetical protein